MTVTRYWPLASGRIITSPFGSRSGGFHAGTDFGWPGGSAGKPVYAVQAGTVIHAGAAQGYGGPDPAGWLVIDSAAEQGGGCLEYGHIIREVAIGARVQAGQRIGHINPDTSTNGGVAPHLHLADMPYAYNPATKQDPLPRLAGAREPGQDSPVADTIDPVAVLSRLMGGSVTADRYRQLLPAVTQCLADCGCTTINRIAMWGAQIGHEAVGLLYMAEIWGPTAAQRGYEGRIDLGNTVAGDGYRFRGSGPIQVTGRHNFTVLSQWAFSRGLVPTPTFFVDNPDELRGDRYGFVGVTWYWTTQRPMNDAADARDLERATRYVNGGLTGIDERRTRYNRALSMGTDLLALLEGNEFMAALSEDEQRELLEGVRYIKDQLGPGFDDWGKDGDLGHNDDGKRLTFRAGLAALRRDVTALLRKVGA